jgi:hypothetical protein
VSAPGPASRNLVLALVSHTNVGKTTLARTLLRRDVGEVFDQAHVTDETERFVLLESEGSGRVLLSDNPGFGNSARLLGRLRGREHPLGWLLAQVWDRFADRALFCSQQAVRHVRDEADVVLYLVNASEDPEAAGYVAPELEILGWVGRPVLVLLNQTGTFDEAAAASDLRRWRQATAPHPVVREVLALDAFTRCWLEEGLLYERVRDALAPEKRDLADALLARWRSEQLAALAASVEAMAALLASAAGDAEPVGRGARRRERERAARTLAARLEAAVTDANDRMIELQGLTGEAAEELRVELADVSGGSGGTPSWQRGAWGAVVGGALGGLAADVATGGLSLGGGALAGAILGAAGASGLAAGMERVRGEAGSRVAWTTGFLDRLCTDTVLRYLAVAHAGRGAGAFRPRTPPAAWRTAAERALAPQRPALRAGLEGARAGRTGGSSPALASALAGPLDTALRGALAALHPGAAAYLTEGTRTASPPTSRPSSTGVGPQ